MVIPLSANQDLTHILFFLGIQDQRKKFKATAPSPGNFTHFRPALFRVFCSGMFEWYNISIGILCNDILKKGNILLILLYLDWWHIVFLIIGQGKRQ